MIKTVLFLLVFFVSSWGYWEYFRKHTDVSVYFLPVLTVSSQFCILILAGFLNMMAEAALVMYAGGILLLIDGFRKEGLQAIRPYCTWGCLLFALIFAFWMVTGRGKSLVVEDDFAHWGIVVKKMLEKNRLPNFADEMISFQKYPLGTSLWIWFFCYFLGPQEDMMLLAQGYMVLCCVFPWMYAATRNKLLCTLLIILGLGRILSYVIPVYYLMVDAVLPLTGMAALFFAYCQREKDTRGILLVVPMLVWASQVKNSGILFALAGSLVLILSGKWEWRQKMPRLVCGAAPAAACFLWSRHCDLVFAHAAFSKHAMSVEGYATNLGLKTADQIRTIVVSVTEYVLTRQGLRTMVLYLAVLGVLTLLFFRRRKNEYGLLCMVCAGLSAAYYVGICGMYLFSMPTHEALILAAIERYMSTLDIALLYLMILYGLRLLSDVEGIRMRGAFFGALLLVGIWCFRFPFGFLDVFLSRPDTSERDAFHTVLEDYGVQPGARYVICNRGYLDYYYFLCRYTLDAEPLCLEVESPEQLEAASDYDVLINFDTENPIIADWIAENYPDSQGQQVVWMYH